jgi:hypothetical protein
LVVASRCQASLGFGGTVGLIATPAACQEQTEQKAVGHVELPWKIAHDFPP